ncbi:hypothetical protein EMIHUDRAFT_198103 [Emiliania huxleyi CCMP1516]|uniref:Uncharacterized protein n=2 Tax=Emiliania huxleyi TaxID=2903 RepID=A0A0D3IE96_EMIH1|nr:hypothetical protein EMIHUDRAFT_198103 [Emiliania huxleyi CCMP1516]EOD09581.1 hypothetical protein EMIHUDRAFT_198103 [Emiliania huxleyi CCMP1516]|eukprot:XP_005762010.1 hypothetical protein EMIHUDRAFT_198103 [Emiliania huxleyi CCMP1516]
MFEKTNAREYRIALGFLISWSAATWASGPAAAARPVEAGLGPARDGWPPTSTLALLVKMAAARAAVAIAATKVQSYSAQASKTGASYAASLRMLYLEFFYPHDSERECIRGILWVVQSIDLWLVSRGHLMTPMKYSDRHLAGL